MSEKGYAHSKHLKVSRERVAGLQWPRSQETYTEMLRTSAKVAQVARAITQPIERATWRVTANGAPDEIVQHVADDLRLPIHGNEEGLNTRRSNGRVSWQEHLQQVVQAPFFGVAFFEQVYAPGDDGREHLVKLAHRHNSTISERNIADDGGLISIEQKPQGGNSKIVIPVDSLVVYCFQPRDKSWNGESLLRPVYKHWRAVNDLEELEFQIIHRNGMGVPIYEQSESTADEDRDAEREEGLKMATNLWAGESAGASVRPGAKLTLQGIQGQTISPSAAISYHNNKIAEAMLANFLNLDGGGGSYALAGTQADFFFQELQTIADWIASTANQHIVEDLVRLAFPEYEGPAPLITMTPIAAKKEIAPGDLSQLANAGVLTKEPNVEGWVRQNYDIPASRSIEDALKAKSDREHLEEKFGVKLVDEPDSDAVDDVVHTVETNARYRAAMANQAELEKLIDAKLENLRGSYE